MKAKVFLTLTLLFATIISNAQIKVHSDNHISIGSLTRQYGTQVDPSGYTYFEKRNDVNWDWITVTNANARYSKCWIVNNQALYPDNPHRFYVTGNGYIYKTGEWTRSDSRFQVWYDNVENAVETLENINGFYYTSTDELTKIGERMVGFTASEVATVIPEAVCKDDNDVMYVNYEVLTVFLVEALKEQQQEIQELRKILEENDFLK